MLGSLHMGWRHVLFANWPVDPDMVRPHVPDSMILETYDGAAWLSVVPFTNVDVRPTWSPSAVGFSLPELNLRTYVVREKEPGVYFFNLDAQGILGVVGARLFHHLPYYYARIDLTVAGGEVSFRSDRLHPGSRPAQFRATYAPTGERFEAGADSLSEFLTERHRYYTKAASGTVRYAEVDHEPWPLYQARVAIDENTLFRANGFDDPDTDPVHYYSPGVDTIASPSYRLRSRDVGG